MHSQGPGKTIVLDAIRGLLLGNYGRIERNIVRKENDFSISADLKLPDTKENYIFNYEKDKLFQTDKLDNNGRFLTTNMNINYKFSGQEKETKPWVVNYWTSKLASDNFEIKSLTAPKPENYLLNSLNGIRPNVEVTQLICFFDYLRSSSNPREIKQGEFLYDLLKKIIKISLIDGEFKYVERQTLTPIIYQSFT